MLRINPQILAVLLTIWTFTAFAPITDSLAQSNNPLAARESSDAAPIKEQTVENFVARDFRGKEWSLEQFADREILVVAFLGTECPLVQLYASRLNEIADRYKGDSVALIGVNSNQHDSITELAHFARKFDIEFPLLKDSGNKIADSFNATRTPEVFVLDRDRIVRYRGAIDDEYHYGVQRSKAEKHFLIDAIEDLAKGRAVEVAKTESVGCLIGRVMKPDESSDVTYSNQIVRILQKRCVNCHRKGEIAPFELTDYDEVVGWAEMIDEVVREQRMPPWSASAEHGTFVNDARLTNQEKSLIKKWVANGAPKGDESKLPEPIQFTEGWQIGEPDAVFEMAKQPFNVPATGEVPYKHFVVDPKFTEDKWIVAAECRPGNRSVVHHIIVAAIDKRGRPIHGRVGSEWITATAPGAAPLLLPEGYAKFVPAGSKLVFQMHYTPNGSPQEDISKVGFKFTDEETVKYVVATKQAANHRFEIPPGEKEHPVNSSYTFDRDAQLLNLFPHMHYRGKSFRYEATYPNKRKETLLVVPRYDFNWQLGYQLSKPKTIPKGTRIRCYATFDNSEENLANPDPTETVRWGDQTWEEMMIGYFDIAVKRD